MRRGVREAPMYPRARIRDLLSGDASADGSTEAMLESWSRAKRTLPRGAPMKRDIRIVRSEAGLVAQAGFSAEIELSKITGGDAAQRERFLGSPTVRVDGDDAELRTDFSMKCRC